MAPLTHIDEEGHVRMVDVSDKEITSREAVARGVVSMEASTFERIQDQQIKKGNVLETARIAGVMAAKKTWDLIPMCHPLDITHAEVNFFPDGMGHTIHIEATVRIKGRTGVEMEALTAVAVAALTIYDMCKSHDRSMIISEIGLVKKAGGKSGTYHRS